MKARLAHYRLLGPALVSVILGYALRGAPLDPDTRIEGIYVLGTFLIFLYWALGMLAWGGVISRALGVASFGLGFRVAIGAGGAALTAALLGHLGWIGYGELPLFF